MEDEQEILERIQRGESIIFSDRAGRRIIGSFGSGLVDRNGVPQKRTKSSHPYSYDPFLTGRWEPNFKCNATDWSDRLHQWDHKKHRRLADKHFKEPGCGFRNPIIEEHCNQSNGFPCWMINY